MRYQSKQKVMGFKVQFFVGIIIIIIHELWGIKEIQNKIIQLTFYLPKLQHYINTLAVASRDCAFWISYLYKRHKSTVPSVTGP